MLPSGFQAIIGDNPGDQIAQGGTFAYHNEWYSDQAIGQDPVTGADLILGHFTLAVDNPVAFELTENTMSFTASEVYSFSTGTQIHGSIEFDSSGGEP